MEGSGASGWPHVNCFHLIDHSILHPPSSILYPLSSILHPPSSILHPPSSILHPLSSFFTLVLVAWRSLVRGGRHSHEVDGAGLFLRNRCYPVMVARPIAFTLEPASSGQRGGVRGPLFGLDRDGCGPDKLAHFLRHRKPRGLHAPAAQPSPQALSLARDAGPSVQSAHGQFAVVRLCTP